jgi:hypothetical protein
MEKHCRSTNWIDSYTGRSDRDENKLNLITKCFHERERIDVYKFVCQWKEIERKGRWNWKDLYALARKLIKILMIKHKS